MQYLYIPAQFTEGLVVMVMDSYVMPITGVFVVQNVCSYLLGVSSRLRGNPSETVSAIYTSLIDTGTGGIDCWHVLLYYYYSGLGLVSVLANHHLNSAWTTRTQQNTACACSIKQGIKT